MTVGVLQLDEKKKEEWEKRDILFTDRALYIFAPVLNEREQTLNYLTAPFERLEIKNYAAHNPIDSDQGRPDEPSQAPLYSRWLPKQNAQFYLVIELMKLTTSKVRLVALSNQSEVAQFIDIFNVVACYRRYEAMLEDKFGDKDSGPEFIATWVRNYPRNKGLVKFTADLLNRKTSESFFYFAKSNTSVKGLIFDDALLFSNSSKRLLREEHNIGLTAILQGVFEVLGPAPSNITEVRFTNNLMDDGILRNFLPSIYPHGRLITLELSCNKLGDEVLEDISKMFSENLNLEEIILNNNKFGNTGSKHHLEIFLQAFLLDLRNPQKLDFSCNQIGDSCLETLIYYLLANHNSQITSLNLEYNSFSNYAKRTFAQACLLCPNQELKVRHGPISLTETNLSILMQARLQDERPNQETQDQQRKQKQQRAVTLTIIRKPAIEKLGMRYLPIGKYETDQLAKIRAKIEYMCSVDRRNQIYTEDLRKFVEEITELQFEFPKHLMQPLFHLVNQKITKAIEEENLYQLELLLDALFMMDSENEKAQAKYEELQQIARGVASNLVRAINMEIHDDSELLRVLTQNLTRAKEMGMRGEIIDIADTLKSYCLTLLQEMIHRSPASDDETDPSKQVIMMKEEDLRRSVYDNYYDKFIDLEDKNLTTELEPNLALHPYKTDYINTAGLNLYYLKKNLAVSRKLLSEEETYSLLNIYTRCAFILCGSAEQESHKSLEFANARDDRLLRFARLLFRYRHNLDELFEPAAEPVCTTAFADYEKKLILKHIINNLSSGGSGKRMEQYPGIDRMDVRYSSSELIKPLIQTNQALNQAALKFNQQLILIQRVGGKNHKDAYKPIRSLFEEFVIRSSQLIVEEMADEFYLQLYRQCNTSDGSVAVKPMFLVLAFLSRYMIPTPQLKLHFEEWLYKKRAKESLDRYIRHILCNFKILSTPENFPPSDHNTLITWPPSTTEIHALDAGKSIRVKIVFPDGASRDYEIDEAATVETLMKEKIFPKSKMFKNGLAEPQLYWLYSYEQNLEYFPVPISREKRLLKLLYDQEKSFEQVMDFDRNNRRARQSSLLRKTMSVDRKLSMPNLGGGSEFTGLTLFIRERIFSSLHSMPSFKSLNKDSLNFIFYQIKRDYVEYEILRRPLLSLEHAYLLAALALQVKRYKKILTSKDNALKRQEISQSYSFCVPRSIQLQKPIMKDWDQSIMECFEQQNIKELTIEEAQEQFLTLIASYRYTFGSHFIVKRKPPFGLITMALMPGGASGNISSRRDPMSLENLQKKMAAKSKKKQKGGAGGKTRKTKFDESGSSNESSSESSSEASAEDKSGGSRSASQRSDMNSDDEDDMSVSLSSKSEISGLSMKHEQNSEVLEDIFPSHQKELLLIVTYEQLIFLNNEDRNLPILEIRLENILYVMGKSDTLKIAFQLNSNVLSKDQQQKNGVQIRSSAMRQNKQTNDKYQQDTIDIKTVFIIPNARVVAEDILAYVQVNLLEMTKSKEYVEIVKPQIADFLALDNSHSLNKSTEHEGGERPHSKTNNLLQRLKVNDDLLLGNVDFKDVLDAQKLRDMGAKIPIQFDSQNLQQQSDLENMDSITQAVSDSDSDEDMDVTMDKGGGTARRPMTSAQRHARKIEKRAGHQFKLKKSEFMVYSRKHPTYAQPSAQPGGNDISNSRLNISGRSNSNSRKMNKKAIIARENLTGQSFALETHTIDEESEGSQESPTSRAISLKDTSSSNFKSQPKYADPLGQIEESPYEDGNFASARPPKADNYSPGGIGKEKQRKQYDTQRGPSSNQMTGVPPQVPAGRGIPRPPAPGIRPRPPANNMPQPPQPGVGRPRAPAPKAIPRPPGPPVRAPAPRISQPAPYAEVAKKKPSVDFNAFMKGSQQSQSGDRKLTMDDAAKDKMADQFSKLQASVPASSTNFEKSSRADMRSSMAKIFSAMPPPPPPPMDQAAAKPAPKPQPPAPQQPKPRPPQVRPKPPAPAAVRPRPPAPAAKPHDFAAFMRQSSQVQSANAQTDTEKSKQKVQEKFDDMKKSMSKASTNFERKDASTSKNNLANIMAGLPPPPP